MRRQTFVVGQFISLVECWGAPNEALADLRGSFADDLQLALGKWEASHTFTLSVLASVLGCRIINIFNVRKFHEFEPFSDGDFNTVRQ
jgi:hypothetical protein